MPKYRYTKESELVSDALEWLHEHRIMAWRNNTGMFRRGKRFIRAGYPGSPDIIGILHDGTFLGVEAKVGSRKLSKDQELFLRMIRLYNGVALVIRSLEDLKTGMKGRIR